MIIGGFPRLGVPLDGIQEFAIKGYIGISRVWGFPKLRVPP